MVSLQHVKTLGGATIVHLAVPVYSPVMISLENVQVRTKYVNLI